MNETGIRKKSYNQWMNSYISPGPTAQIGDVLPNVKLKHSAPELPLRYLMNDNQMEERGGNIQDGQWYSESTGGLGAKTIVQDFYHSSTESISRGFLDTQGMFGTCSANDDEPVRIINRPLERWKLTQATITNALSTGSEFTPLPNGYVPSGVPRGPQPQSSFIAGADYVVYNPTGSIPGQNDIVANQPVVPGQPQTVSDKCISGVCPIK